MQGNQRRAVLIGCNYVGTDAQLKGCINDVFGMRDILINIYGFQNQNIAILIDTDDRFQKPIGKNIKQTIAYFIDLSQPGDCLVIHYSGHGTQVPTPANPGNPNGLAQAIVPCDMNIILDDDLVDIFIRVRQGVIFTLIADCCHSGTLLNQQSVVIGGTGGLGGGGGQGLGGLASVFGLKDLPEGLSVGSPGVKNRGLHHEQLSDIFNNLYSSILGYTVNSRDDPTSLHRGMNDTFGQDASNRAIQFVNMAETGLNMAGKYGVLDQSQLRIASMVLRYLGKMCGGGSQQQTDSGPQQSQYQQQGGQKAPNEYLGDGVLISGCTSDETSADACPSGDPQKAYGALSNALQTAVREHLQKYGPQQPPITYRDLVTQIREMLHQTGFKQHPCLEGYIRDVDRPFILG